MKELEQYRSICAEIQEINIVLKDNTVYGAVRGSDREFPYIQRTIKVEGITSTKDNLRYLARLDRLRKKKESIECFVDSIDDSLTRRVFEYRYITGKRKPSWLEIAFKIGKNDESYPRRIHNKYLKKYNVAENAEN